MSTEVVIGGRGETGSMVWTPAPGMAKSIVFVPPMATVGIEDRLAERAGAAVGRRINQERAVRDDELGLEWRRPSDWASSAEHRVAMKSRGRGEVHAL